MFKSLILLLLISSAYAVGQNDNPCKCAVSKVGTYNWRYDYGVLDVQGKFISIADRTNILNQRSAIKACLKALKTDALCK